MAVDAGLISPLGLGAEAGNMYKMVPDYASMQLQRAKLEVDRQQAQALHDRQKAAAEAAARGEALWKIYQAHPTGENLSNYYANDPEHAAGTKQAAGAYAQSTQQFQQASNLYYLAKKDPKAGGAGLRKILDANIAANGGVPPEDDADDEEIYQDLISGDATREALANSRMLESVANLSGDRDAFLTSHDKLFPKAEEHWDNGLLYVYEAGKPPRLIAQGPPGSRIGTRADGSTYTEPLIDGIPVMTPGALTAPARPAATEAPPGGGTPPPEGTPPPAGTPPPRRTMGMTPRQRDGGDNTNAQVDNKLGVMAKRTGYGIDALLNLGDIPAVYDAYVATEKGVGLRGNNPGNIIDSPWTRAQPGFVGVIRRKNAPPIARFDSPANGRRAGIALMNRKYQAGHRTMRDLIEGRPEGQGAITQPGQVAGGTPPTKTINGRKYVKMRDGKWYEAS